MPQITNVNVRQLKSKNTVSPFKNIFTSVTHSMNIVLTSITHSISTVFKSATHSISTMVTDWSSTVWSVPDQYIWQPKTRSQPDQKYI